MSIERLVRRLPYFWRYSSFLEQRFPGSQRYWEERYATGGNSGRGSYGKLAIFKAGILNDFVESRRITSVIEFGCGDGNQLSLARYPIYIGLDVSRSAIMHNIERNRNDSTKSFFLYDPDCWDDSARRMTADLGLSLDVLYHLIEDRIFERHLDHLFSAADRYVIIYSSDYEKIISNSHERHRKFTDYVARKFPAWSLSAKVENNYPLSEHPESGTYADFYIYKKNVSPRSRLSPKAEDFRPPND